MNSPGSESQFALLVVLLAVCAFIYPAQMEALALGLALAAQAQAKR